MNTNTIKISIAAFLVHLMCFTVVLSHIHAKDAINLLTSQSNLKQMASTDITAKALGDLHHHIDKTRIKNMTAVTANPAARKRELDPLASDHALEMMGAQFYDFMLRLRVVGSLCFQYV